LVGGGGNVAREKKIAGKTKRYLIAENKGGKKWDWERLSE